MGAMQEIRVHPPRPTTVESRKWKEDKVWVDNLGSNSPTKYQHELAELNNWMEWESIYMLYDLSKWMSCGRWEDWVDLEVLVSLRLEYNVFLTLIHESGLVYCSLADGRSRGMTRAYEVNEGYKIADDHQNNTGIDRKWAKVWCKDWLPKVNIFYCILANRKTLTMENMRKRCVAGPMRCILCKNAEESL